MNIKEIAETFEIKGNIKALEPISMGHIGVTTRVLCDAGTDYILQKINTKVFPDVQGLMENIAGVTEFIRKKVIMAGGDPEREVLTLIKNKNGGYLYEKNGEYYRLYICINNAGAHNSADMPGLFGRAGEAFGKFQQLLADYPAETLHETIPHFHDTPKRLNDLEKSAETNKSGRLDTCKAEVEFYLARKDFAHLITDKLASGGLPVRVTHNDTKLNNVMFDNTTGEPICIVDLDTVMPGSSLYDFGDSIRFGASTAAEDEQDLTRVRFSAELFEEYVRGYLSTAGRALTPEEKNLLPESAVIMTLECGARFLADYIDGDVYFATDYPEHNLVRARTQLKLVAEMEEKLPQMKAIVAKYI